MLDTLISFFQGLCILLLSPIRLVYARKVAPPCAQGHVAQTSRVGTNILKSRISFLPSFARSPLYKRGPPPSPLRSVLPLPELLSDNILPELLSDNPPPLLSVTARFVSDHLAFLPATLLTLTVALSPEDREVLAYLISCTGNSSEGRRNDQKQKSVTVSGSGGDHPASFNCNCFRCYMSYWVPWDSSPNRQLIHEILDGFEDLLLQQRANSKSKRERRRRGGHGCNNDEKRFEESSVVRHEIYELESVEVSGSGDGETCGGGGGGCVGEEEVEKGSVRRFVNFIGERIWGVWGP